MGTHTIVCLSSQPWYDGMWTNKQHIMSRLAKRHQVLYVNFGFCRTSQLLGLKRSQSRLGWRPWRWLVDPAVQESHGVTVLDFFTPASGIVKRKASHPARIYTQFDLRVKLLGRHLRQQGIDRSILWVYHPGYGASVASIPHKPLVYDCVDEYAQFPDYRDDPGWLQQRERALCRRADVVFTTAPGLYDKKRPLNPDNTYLVHNVGDSDHFGRVMDEDLEVAADVASLPKPVIGFVGAVSNYKVNFEWLLELARARPDWSVALIGPVGVGDPGTDIAALREQPNLHLLGHRPYDELPAYVKAFDVALIPYRINDYTTYSFPIKFFEFLATGKPVVISPLPAVERYWDEVLVAHDASELVSCCEQALRDPDSGRDRRRALAQQNSWPARVAKMMEQVELRLAEPG